MATMQEQMQIFNERQRIDAQNQQMRNLMNFGGSQKPQGFVGPRQMSLLDDRPMYQTAINFLRNPAAMRSLGVVPGLGLLAGGLTAGSALINAFQDDDIQAAESEIGWVARSLDPTINLTGNTSATGKHSETGKFIVFPTYRTRNGNFVKLNESTAKSRSEKLNDFIEFDSKEEADQFVNKLKNEVTERQKLFNTQNRGIL